MKAELGERRIELKNMDLFHNWITKDGKHWVSQMIDPSELMTQWKEKFSAELKWYEKLNEVDDALGLNVSTSLTLGGDDGKKLPTEELH